MRNERAIIMFLSYVIGFNAAFIAFGIPNFFQPVPTGTIVAAVSKAEREVKETAPIANTKTVRVEKDPGEENALVVWADSKKRYLSIHDPESQTETVGVHTEILYTSISPDERFIYYCEVQVADSEKCAPLVYSVEDDVIHRVWVDEERNFVDKASELAPTWEADGKLKIGNATSLTSDTPWILRS